MGHNYTVGEKLTAVELYKKLGHLTWVIQELGYPSRGMLYAWIKEYQETGAIDPRGKRQKYSEDQRKQAVAYYLNCGRSISKTVCELGYPGKTLLNEWLKEDLPESQRCRYFPNGRSVVRYTPEQKETAIRKYVCREATSAELSAQFGVSPVTIQRWAKEMSGEKEKETLRKKKQVLSDIEHYGSESMEDMIAERQTLEQELARLKEEVFHLRMQKEIYEKAAELLKKGKGTNLKILTNKEKAILIDALRSHYRLKDLLTEIGMSKSSYCYCRHILSEPDKYLELREKIRSVYLDNYSAYGYRRIHRTLKAQNVYVSEKVIRRIMAQENLLPYCRKRRKYSSYKGEISPAVPNIIDRNFHAERPNEKWLTDITEFQIPAGKIYLSPIIDCFDGCVVTWSISSSPNSVLVNGMLDAAIATLGDNEKPLIHSDRGCHYRWPGWIERMERAGLTRSMSRKGCSPDNSACEGFFGRMKNEMFYGRSWMNVSLNSFEKAIDTYIHWYNERRIKLSLGSLSPLEYRNRYLSRLATCGLEESLGQRAH